MQRSTARDVAKLAGCSVSSVSLVVNGRHKGRIKPVLRARILDAIERLDYRPNRSASSLALQAPPNVVFVCPDIRNPFVATMYYGLITALEGAYDVDLRVGLQGADYNSGTVREAQSGNIGGLVLANPSSQVLSAFSPTCPTVLVDVPEPNAGTVAVTLDLVGGSKQVAQHLVDWGHRKVAYIDLELGKETFSLRRAAVRDALRAAGGDLTQARSTAELSMASGGHVFGRAWPSWQRSGITAVVCADDVLAFGVLQSARAMGVSIPDDLCLVGFNDSAYCTLVDPPLTSVRFDAAEVGRQAGSRLLNLINGEATDSIVLGSTLIVRKSSQAGLRNDT